MPLLFQCHCGQLRGQLADSRPAVRGVCYCRDCRAYSLHLGALPRTHDDFGGADFVATLARNVTVTHGARHLACLSWSPKGPLRWYAACCDTPVANTMRTWRLPYVGLLSPCLQVDPAAFERRFPTVRMRTNTGSARKPPPAMALQTIASLAGFVPRMVASGITGSHVPTPFFTSPLGKPVAEVTVPSDAQRAAAYAVA